MRHREKTVMDKSRLQPFCTPPIPPQEDQRLAELQALQILDTGAEERFDHYTQLAADIFEVPIALITLVDQNRQWFKSAHGLDVPQTPRDVAFCAHAILERDILVIPDARRDPRFAGNPLVVGRPFIRFYAGAVLRGPTGQPIGTLCLIDDRPRELSDRQCRQLINLAQMLEAELQHNYHRQFFVLFPDLLGIAGSDGYFRHLTPTWEHTFGYSLQEFLAYPYIEFVHPEDREATLTAIERLSQGEKITEFDIRCSCRDGSYKWVRWNGVADIEKGFFYLTGREITARKHAEQHMQLWSRVVEVASNGVLITDPNQPGNPIVSVNPAFEQATGYAADDIVGHNCRFLQGDDRDQAEIDRLRSAVKEGQECRVVLRNYRKDGSLFWNELFVAPVRDTGGKITHFIGIQNDITERKSYEAQLEYQATHDALTRLPNRTLFYDRLNQALAHAHRSGQQVAILFVDLDRFKMINDSLGHAIGDVLLQTVAARLKACMREGDTMARLGGDEFVIVLLEDQLGKWPQELVSSTLAYRILEVLEQPFSLKGRELFISCSIGISLFPGDGEDPQTLLQNADAAMYRAKQQGRNGVQFYTQNMNARALERLELEKDLRYALKRQELELYYQPQVDLEHGQIIGMEVLLRWHHPQRGWVSPAQFIPLAEETGLIVPIGEWVLRTACAQARAWQDQGLPAVCIGVNLSARQFLQVDLIDLVARVLQETGLAPTCLELEITEGLLMQDVERAIDTLGVLRSMGVRLSIDDFGTGYSSLNYLKRFPIDRLKIDKSFVNDIIIDADNAAIVLAVIAMAHSLRLKVIAEGVETETQLAFLRSKNCDEIQGYYFSRPLPATEMAALLGENRKLLLAKPAYGT